jgi:hypothetical protein
LGGTAYYAGTGFVLSGTIALIDIVLFQQLLGLSTAKVGLVLAPLMIVMLPIVRAYHAHIDRLYHQQREKTKEVSGEGSSQPR